MTGIYLIRHAEAEGNIYRRIHGWYDGNVTPRGLLQIAALKKRFENITIDAVYSSDMTRTVRTAAAVTGENVPEPILEPRLRELNMGYWEDKTWGWATKYDAQMIDYFNNHDVRFKPMSGESYAELKARAVAAFRDIAAANEGRTVAIVSHGICLREILSTFSDSETAFGHSDNTGVSYVEWEDGEARLVYANDNSHLNDEISTLAHQFWWRKENIGRESLADVNLRFEPLDMRTRKHDFERRRRDAWQGIYGDLRGYSPAYADEAARRALKNPEGVLEVLSGDESCGVLELNAEREKDENVGCVSFVYLDPEYRDRGIGAQLIGCAVSYYRGLEREKLRLRVAEINTEARKAYEKCGFKYTAEEPGLRCTQLVMELDLW